MRCIRTKTILLINHFFHILIVAVTPSLLKSVYNMLYYQIVDLTTYIQLNIDIVRFYSGSFISCVKYIIHVFLTTSWISDRNVSRVNVIMLLPSWIPDTNIENIPKNTQYIMAFFNFRLIHTIINISLQN